MNGPFPLNGQWVRRRKTKSFTISSARCRYCFAYSPPAHVLTRGALLEELSRFRCLADRGPRPGKLPPIRGGKKMSCRRSLLISVLERGGTLSPLAKTRPLFATRKITVSKVVTKSEMIHALSSIINVASLLPKQCLTRSPPRSISERGKLFTRRLRRSYFHP